MCLVIYYLSVSTKQRSKVSKPFCRQHLGEKIKSLNDRMGEDHFSFILVLNSRKKL